MIEYKERGILIFSKISSENNLYLKILTQKDEIITGLSFGGSTKKKKNIFQIGYFLNIVIKNKNKNFPNSISAELSKPYYHNIFNDKYKLHGLLALVSLLNISIIASNCSKLLYLTRRYPFPSLSFISTLYPSLRDKYFS